MSKKLKLLLLGITVVIAGFFIIVLFSGEEDQVVLDLREKNTFEDPENYEFEEKGEKMLVKNDNLGFSFEVPKDWSVSAYEEDGEEFGYVEDIKGITFFSPDYNLVSEKREEYIEDGCKLGVTIFDYGNRNDKDYNRLEVLEEEIQEYKNGEEPRYDYVKLVKINNYHGVGYFFDATPNDWQKSQNTGNILIRILVENRIYNIEAIFSPKDTEECQENFHNLLDSISFTKNEQ
jgi:hypothetical protein